MPTCVVKCCSRSTLRDKKEQGITFHRFPKENEWRKDWIRIIRECRGQIDWNPTKSSVVCSEHFQTSDLYTTKGGLLRVVTYAVPEKLLRKPTGDEQKNEQPSVAERPLQETLDRQTLSDEEGLHPIVFTSVSEICLVADKVSKTLINKTDFSHYTDVPSHSDATNVVKAEADFEQPSPSSILYTPKEKRLKEIILQKNLHISHQKHKIKILNQKIRRLKNANSFLKNIIKTLKN